MLFKVAPGSGQWREIQKPEGGEVVRVSERLQMRHGIANQQFESAPARHFFKRIRRFSAVSSTTSMRVMFLPSPCDRRNLR
jgi:hypothetical protein